MSKAFHFALTDDDFATITRRRLQVGALRGFSIVLTAVSGVCALNGWGLSGVAAATVAVLLNWLTVVVEKNAWKFDYLFQHHAEDQALLEAKARELKRGRAHKELCRQLAKSK